MTSRDQSPADHNARSPGRRDLRDPVAKAFIELLEVRSLLSGSVLDFSAGFTDPSPGIGLNGLARFVVPTLELTGPLTNSLPFGFGRAISSAPLDVSSFNTHFRVRTTDGSPRLGFVIQNNDAITSAGGHGTGGFGRSGSVAVAFDPGSATSAWANFDQPLGSGVATMSTDGIDLASGHVFDVTLSYDGTTLRELVVDTETSANFVTQYAVDIPAVVGGTSSILALIAARGPTQDVLSWTYAAPDPAAAPAAPSGLHATDVQPYQVSLAWQDNAADELGYLVFRRSGGAGAFQRIAKLPANSTGFIDSGVNANTGQEYRVEAYNAAAEFSAAVTSLTTPLAPPRNVAAIVKTPLDGSAVIRWDAIGGGVTYNLYRSTSASGGEGSAPYRNGLTGTTFTDTGVPGDQPYFYQLTAVSGASESTRSEEVSTIHHGLHASYFAKSPDTSFFVLPLPSDDHATFTRTDVAGPSSGSVLPEAASDVFDTGVIAHDPAVNALPSTHFGVRWEGTFTPSQSDTYSFGSSTNVSNSPLRVSVNGQVVFSQGDASAPLAAAIALTADTAYAIEIELSGFRNFNPGFANRVRLEYSTAADPTVRPVPLSLLSDVVRAPTLPVDFRVTSTGQGTANLAWNEGSANTALYTVEHSLDNVNFTPAAQADGPAGVSVTVGQLVSGATHYFRLRASSAAGDVVTGSISLVMPGLADTTFGSNGVVDLPPGTARSLGSIVQPDGKLLVASYDSVTDYDNDIFYDELVLTRYQPDGTLDTAFGNAGQVRYTSTDFADFPAFLNIVVSGGDVVADGDGGFYVSLQFGLYEVMSVTHFDGDGQWDRGFGVGGVLTTGVISSIDESDPFPRPANLAVDAQGRLVVVGAAVLPSRGYGPISVESDFAVERYLPDGTVDASFGTGGRVTTAFPAPFFDVELQSAVATSVTFDANGRLVVVGYAATMLDPAVAGSEGMFVRNFAVVRYNADGSLDTTFSGDGRLTTSFHAGGHPYVAGSPFPNAYESGIGPLYNVYKGAAARSVVVDAQGRVIVGGESQNYLGTFDGSPFGIPVDALSSDFALARYLPDGTLDSTFGNGGLVSTVPHVGGPPVLPLPTDPGGDPRYAVSQGQVRRLSIDGAGRILAAGDFLVAESQYFSRIPLANTIAVLRYDANGSLDPTFADGGRLNSNFGGKEIRFEATESDDASFDVLEAFTLASDGNYVVVGNSSGSTQRVFVAKFLSELAVNPGTIDTELQSKATTLQNAGSRALITYQAKTTAQVDAFLDAVAELEVDTSGPTVRITLEAGGNTFSGQTVTVPAGVVLTINDATFEGHSPSLILTSGTLVLSGCTLTNATDAPTVRVLGGTLTLRDTLVEESSVYTQAALEMAGGVVELGTAADPAGGGNTFTIRGGGEYVRNLTSKPVMFVLNTPAPGGPAGAASKALVVAGTGAGDSINVDTDGAGGVLVAANGGKASGPFRADRLIVSGGGGDDAVQVAGSVTLPAWLYGGGGADRLNAGNGPAVLVGGAGADSLGGGSGRDILIGGDGGDRLVGNAGDDVLIAGYTLYDADEAALGALAAEWGRAGASYPARIANLSSGVSSGLNGTFAFRTGTVFDDRDDRDADQVDLLTGSAGDDWYFADRSGGEDKVTGVTSGEQINEL